MAIYSLAEHASIINQQITVQEDLLERLSKAEALANVALGEDFLNYKPFIIHAYLWALCSIIEEAKVLNQQTLDVVCKIQHSLKEVILE
jgi:hypothetical protein